MLLRLASVERGNERSELEDLGLGELHHGHVGGGPLLGGIAQPVPETPLGVLGADAREIGTDGPSQLEPSLSGVVPDRLQISRQLRGDVLVLPGRHGQFQSVKDGDRQVPRVPP